MMQLYLLLMEENNRYLRYHNRVKEKIYTLLQGEKKYGALLSQCNVKYVAGEDVQANADWFINVNTKEEYVGSKTFQMNERFLIYRNWEQLLYKDM